MVDEGSTKVSVTFRGVLIVLVLVLWGVVIAFAVAAGIITIVAAIWGASAQGATMPDLKLTPGCVLAVTADQVCGHRYAQSVRNVPDSVKHSVCLAYGIREGCPGPSYEVDHLISLTLGGSNEPCNLWPQPIKEARFKDRWEYELHMRVCGIGGRTRIPLSDAQKQVLDAAKWEGTP